MELENKPYSVYVKTDDKNRITAINSDAFLSSLDGWIKVDEGHGDKYHHAQGNYLPLPLMEERGLYRYKLSGTEIEERAPEEIDADYKKPEVPSPSTPSDPALINRILELEAQLAAYESAYAQGVNEA